MKVGEPCAAISYVGNSAITDGLISGRVESSIKGGCTTMRTSLHAEPRHSHPPRWKQTPQQPTGVPRDADSLRQISKQSPPFPADTRARPPSQTGRTGHRTASSLPSVPPSLPSDCERGQDQGRQLRSKNLINYSKRLIGIHSVK